MNSNQPRYFLRRSLLDRWAVWYAPDGGYGVNVSGGLSRLDAMAVCGELNREDEE